MTARARTTLYGLVAVVAGLAGLYALLGFVGAPYWIERKLPDYAAQLGLRASVEDVRVNPFLLTLEARGLEVDTPDGVPLLEVQRVVLDLDASSLARRAWVVDRAEAHGAHLHIVRSGGRLNVDALGGPSRDKTAAPGSGGPPPLVIESLEIADATVEYVDRTADGIETLRVGPIRLTAEDVSTLAGGEGRYVLHAALPEDAALSASGTLTTRPLASRGRVELKALQLATLVPVAIALEGYAPPAGQASSDLQYDFASAEDGIRFELTEIDAALTGFAVRPQHREEAIVAVSRLSLSGAADFAAQSVTVNRLQLSEGELKAVVDPHGELNLARLASVLAGRKAMPSSPSGPWRISIATLAIDDVAVRYVDYARSVPLHAETAALSGTLTGAATVGADAFDARIEQLGVGLDTVTVRQVGDEEPLIRLRSVALHNGRIDTRERRIDADALTVSDGAIRATRDSQAAAPARPTGARPDRSDAGRVTPRSGALHFVAAHSTSGASAQDTKNERPWRIGIDRVAVGNVGVRYADASLPVPAALDIASANLEFALRLAAESSGAKVAVSRLGMKLERIAVSAIGASAPAITLRAAALERGALDTRDRYFEAGTLRLDRLSGALERDDAGRIRLGNARGGAPRAAAAVQSKPGTPGDAASSGGSWQARIGTLQADARALRYVDRALPEGLRVTVGAAQAKLALAVTAAGTQASGIRLHAADIVAGSAGEDRSAQLAAIELEGGRFDSAQRTLSGKRLALRGPEVEVVRTKGGALEVSGIRIARFAQSAPDDAASPPWQYALGTFDLEAGRVAYTDRGFQPAIAYDLIVDASVSDVKSGTSDPVRFVATVKAAQGGVLRAEGAAAQSGQRAEARIRVDGLPLSPLDAFLQDFAAVEIATGTAHAAATVTYDAAPGAPRLAARGSFGITDVRIDEAGTETPVVRWRSVAAEDVKLTVQPNGIDIAEVHITGPEAELVVSEKRTLNLARLLKKDADDTADSDTAATAASSGAARDTAPRFPVHIGRVRLADGTLDFADRSLVLPFSTRVHALEGVVVGLSNAPRSRAELELEGLIADYGSAAAKGSLDPTEPTRFMDISAQFNNVRIAPFSPYTATFAGRIIESGRLWLDLDYRIVQGELSGENKIVMQNLELGRRVEAPNAMDLPLELAIGLLKDSKGRITMAIPVSGSVGDPEFDYGAVIRNAIGNALKRVVTAPFRALASLFGGDVEEVQVVQFEPGSARLSPSEQQQLDEVALALRERPGLELVVRGPYDPARDAAVLREEAVRRRVAAELGNVRAGEAPADPVAFSDRKRRPCSNAC